MEKQERLYYLDSIRGIAALFVAISHCLLMGSTEWAPPQGLLHAFVSLQTALPYIGQKFFPARASVMLFFVLSGFVLAYSLMKHPIRYRVYLVKRFFRIYPMFVAAILGSYALHCLIGYPHEVWSGWMSAVTNPDLSPVVLAEHLVFYGTTQAINLDNVSWSLVHEMRISVIFPFILLSVSKYGWRSVAGWMVLSVACVLWSHHVSGSVIQGFFRATLGLTFLDTAFFIVFFAVGVWLVINREQVAQRVGKLPAWGQITLFVVSLYCFIKSDADPHQYTAAVVDYLRGAGAIGIIACALGLPKLRSILNHATLIWLGRISYSLYLIHIPVMYVVNQTFGAGWPLWLQGAVILSSSLVLSEVTVRLIELPGIEAGKRAAAYVS
jgi:peptidoglycan/LPS O-acetylase OafA/YrhL